MIPNKVTAIGPAEILARQIGRAREMKAEQSSGRVQFGRMSLASAGGTTLVECAIGYRRWKEFDPTNGVGQDAAVIRADATHIVGIVADGVSQSFFGDIAASRLTIFLLDTLWSRRANPPSGDQLSQLLKAFASEVDQEVRRHRISPTLSEITREALESTRISGSQAVFGAFLLDLFNRRIGLYQVGDIDAMVYDSRGAATSIAAQADGRWSSAGMSNLLLQHKVVEDVSGVVLRSDGAGREWGLSLEDAIPDEGRFEEMATRLATKDDVSFVSVSLRQGQHTGFDRDGDKQGTATQAPSRTLIPSSRPPNSIVPRFFLLLIGFLIGVSLGLVIRPQLSEFFRIPGPKIRTRDLGLVKSDGPKPSDSVHGEPQLPNVLVLWPPGSGYKLQFDTSADESDSTFSTSATPSGRDVGTFVFIPFGNGQTKEHVTWHLRQGSREVDTGDLTLVANHFYEMAAVP